MLDKLKKKKEYLLANKIQINEIKNYKILMLVADEIKNANLYSKKQQLKFINDCFFELNKSIKYTTYIQFIRTYVDVASKNTNESNSERIIDVVNEIHEEKKEQPETVAEKPKKDRFKNLKKLNED